MFEGDRPLIMDEFLFCYRPLKINQSLSFYQFTARGKDCRLIKSLVTFDRNWKMEFLFFCGFWSRHPVEVGRDPFTLYTRELGNLHPKCMFIYIYIYIYTILSFAYDRLTLFSFSFIYLFIFVAVR